MSTIKIIASSSQGNCILVGDSLLLDAGVALSAMRRALGLRLTAIESCLVTHEHVDHSRGVPELLKIGVNVYASRGTIEALKIDPDHHRVNIISDGGPHAAGDWAFWSIPIKHDAQQPLAFVVLSADRSIRLLYLTDTAELPEWEWGVLAFTHVLIEANHRAKDLRWFIEAGDQKARRVAANHMSLEGALKSLEQLRLAPGCQVWLTHMSATHGHAERFAKDVLRWSGGDVIVRVAPETGFVDGPRP